MDRAVVLLSGGLGSGVTLAAAREQYEPVLLHVAWGHRAAQREQACVEALAGHFRIDKTQIIDLAAIGGFGGNSRASKQIAIEDASTLTGEIPTTFVAGLLPTLISLAATWATAIKAKRIILGTSENHRTNTPPISALYPDYRREFLQVANLMLQYGKSPRADLLVEAPLLDLSRAEVVELGQRLDFPFEHTWSCYASSGKPCGRCLGCVSRSTGFGKARLPDPLALHPAATSA